MIERNFKYKGFICVVRFNNLGFRCGYVGMPLSCIYHGAKPENIPINCNELTYYGNSLPEDYDNKYNDLWWIGFDCGHIHDGYDTKTWKKYYGRDPYLLSMAKEIEKRQKEYAKLQYENSIYYFHVWTKNDVEKECKYIVDKLLELQST